jgi:hypothetical protein
MDSQSQFDPDLGGPAVLIFLNITSYTWNWPYREMIGRFPSGIDVRPDRDDPDYGNRNSFFPIAFGVGHDQRSDCRWAMTAMSSHRQTATNHSLGSGFKAKGGTTRVRSRPSDLTNPTPIFAERRRRSRCPPGTPKRQLFGSPVGRATKPDRRY